MDKVLSAKPHSMLQERKKYTLHVTIAGIFKFQKDKRMDHLKSHQS